MNKRKKLAFIIATVLTTSLLFGCGSDESSNSGNESSTNEVENTNENTETTEEEVDEERVVEEEILVDNDVLKVTLKSVETGGIFGPEMKIELENKSAETIRVDLNEASVNGIMTNPLFTTEIPAGKKAIEELTFMEDAITEVVNVEGIFSVMNDSWDSIGEYNFTAVTDESAINDNKTEGTIIVDNELVTIAYLGTSTDSIFGPEINIEIVNNTDETIRVAIDDVSVDGYMVSTLFSTEIAVGKKVIDEVTLTSDDITEIKNVEGKFKVTNSESYTSIGEYDFAIE